MTRKQIGHRCGEKHPRARLNDGQVRNMRYEREVMGYTIKEIAAHWKMPYWTVVDILRYKTRASAI